MQIENRTKDYIETLSKNLCGAERVDLFYSNIEFYLKIYRTTEEDIIFRLPYHIVKDFDSALMNHKDQPYYYTIENQLKYIICSGLVEKNITPNLCASEEMINEKGEWINEQVQNLYVVSFDSKMTTYISDGLKLILNALDKVLSMHESMTLTDFETHKENVYKIYKHYQEHGSFNDRVSVQGLQILKAAALCKIIELESEKKKVKITRISQMMDEEIFYIAGEMHDQLFFRIQIPKFMQSIKEFYSESVESTIKKSNINTIVIEDSKQYDIAFSLAHEQHTYVDNVHKNLKKISPNLKIFYYRDEIEEIKFWGKNQFTLFQKIYRDQSKFVIIFISKDYVKKRWTLHEWRSVQEAILDRPEEYLLPARFDDSELEGLPTIINYVDLRNKTPEDFAQMIVKKIELFNSIK